ncbi:signal peptidase II [Rhodohalobacter mucosus]|uniref:Lipoprotein signal peptidase n=1 Tax=Rhodohalobacter mucosus TaxID=2079485 RepID=A0A316TUE5_9BACT|nr:signal peptidase II [Rhodohalobacter mucosus]
MRAKKYLFLFTPAVLVLIADQVTKRIILNSPDLQNKEIIEGWLAFNFTKNPGMALGMDWLSTPVISVVAILATIGIVTYILFTLDKANLGYLTCMGLIVGGALGNITDRILMGLYFGYGGVLEGHVVDFIHFTKTIGDWAVFPYIFNVADIAISTSIIILLVFHKKIMPLDEDESGTQTESTSEEPDMIDEALDPEKDN